MADVFVANQSGNVVRIGMGAVGEYPAWDLALLSMLGFAAILTHVSGVSAQPAFQSANVLSSAQGLLDWAARTDPVHRTGRRLAVLGGLTLAIYAIGGGVGAVAARMSASALLLLLVFLLGCLLLARRTAG